MLTHSPGQGWVRQGHSPPLANAVNFIQIIKIDFCGQWPAEDWVDNNPSCVQKVGTSDCASYVRDNPQAFSASYFLINSVKVFGH
jgi:hypothetical protein